MPRLLSVDAFTILVEPMHKYGIAKLEAKSRLSQSLGLWSTSVPTRASEPDILASFYDNKGNDTYRIFDVAPTRGCYTRRTVSLII